jgi:hypothetical protein
MSDFIPHTARQLLERELPEDLNPVFDYEDAFAYLEELAQALGLDEDRLASLVREAAIQQATDATQGGFSEQVDYLLDTLGPERARDLMLRGWSDR